ncbi:MAG: GYD domain-containing protein [Nitrospirota bacterium]
MPVYVTLYKFTEQGVRNIKGSPKRVEKIKEEFKKAGAQVKEFYALMGQFDTMIIAEAPNEEVITKLNLMIDATGNVTSQTMRAFSENDWKRMVQEAAQLTAELAKAA